MVYSPLHHYFDGYVIREELIVSQSGLSVWDRHVDVEATVFPTGTGVRGGNNRIFVSYDRGNGRSEGGFIASYNLIGPGAGIVDVWLLVTGDRFWKWVCGHWIVREMNGPYGCQEWDDSRLLYRE